MSNTTFFSPNDTVLITGGAGFIGSCLAERLVELGVSTTVIDDLSRGSKSNLKKIRKAIRFIKCDITSSRSLAKIFEGHTIVFNLAALNTGVAYDVGRTEKMFEDNMLLQMLPLRAAASTKSVHSFIQVSSASIYSRNVMESEEAILESQDSGTPEESKLGYAWAKRMGENLAIWYSQNSRLRTVRARFINVYGENDHFDDLGHFISVMIRKFLTAKAQVEVFGSGNQQRSFLHVNDAVEALLLLAQKGKNGDVYNVDSGDEYSVSEVVSLIREFTKKQHIHVCFDHDQPEGSQRRLLNSSKIRKLGWESKVGFDDGLKSTINDIARRISKEQ